jgi:hypothetical protein
MWFSSHYYGFVNIFLNRMMSISVSINGVQPQENILCGSYVTSLMLKCEVEHKKA